MELKKNMEFGMTDKFVANFYQAKKLKITEINPLSVSIAIENSKGRGVFPRDQFQSLIRSGALILAEKELANKEDSA